MKVVAVNIAFREEAFYKRWRLFAKAFGHDVTLIGPKYYEYHKIGDKLTFKPKEVLEHHFCVRHIDMRQRKWLRADWWSWKYLILLVKNKPNLIYLIGYETKNVVLISLLYKLFFNPKVKLGIFTMRGIDMPLNGLEFRFRWSIIRKYIDFVNVHYPHGRKVIREQGRYRGTINLQTQIGVDKDVFFPSAKYRSSIRKKYHINEDDFVFGAAVRIESAKGVFEIIEACNETPVKFKFLLLGDGKEFKEVKELIERKNLGDKIILTGRVQSGEQVCMHMNAMDCFVHIPRTTKEWVDTFPVAVVQAMACALPIIGSDSGAIPYQIGLNEMIISEGSHTELAQKMLYFLNNRTKAREVGDLMLHRVSKCFEIQHLNVCLSQIFEGILTGDQNKILLDQNQWFDERGAGRG